MKSFITLILLIPSFIYANTVEGLGFLKIGEQKSLVQKNMKAKGGKLLPTSYEEQPYPSMQPFKYENVKLTSNFYLDDVELFFHNKKLFQIYVEVNPSPVAYSPDELAEIHSRLYRFENVVSALREKYAFVLDKTEELPLKNGEQNGCNLIIKQTTWNIPAKTGLKAIYFEQKILHPTTKMELASKDIDADVCDERPFNALQIYDIDIRAEVDILMDKAIKEYEQEQIRERKKELDDL